MSKLNKTKFIEAKASGANNTEAALQAGAKNKIAAHKAGYRLSKDTDIKKQLTKAIKRHNIKIENLIQVYAEALKAEKTDRITGEISNDHTIRMKAADKFLDLLGINSQLKDKNPMSPNINQQSNSLLQAALKSGDDIKLLQVFKKTDD